MHSTTGSDSMDVPILSADAGAQPWSAPGAPMYTSSQVPSGERAVTSSDTPVCARAMSRPSC